jgi:Uma2 family endonuclease
MATISPANLSTPRPSTSGERVPPLEQGDRLGRSEFFRRYAAMPPNIKAERIAGMVHMAAAAHSSAFHGQPHAALIGWLFTYWAATPGVVVSDNSTVLLDFDNDPQPDAFVRILPTHGGRTTLTPEGYVQGPPELIVEVAASSVSFDLGSKLHAYRRNGVSEYLVYRAYDEQFDWFVLRDGQYERHLADAQNIYRSQAFPGLWLKADAFVAGQLTELLSVLRTGLASPEHEDFVRKLAGQQG